MTRFVQMTEDEFNVVSNALEMANSPYDDEDMAELLAREASAWEVVRRVRSRHMADPDGTLPAPEAIRSL